MNNTDFDPYDFSYKKIEGVEVYYKNLPTAPCAYIRFSLGTGSYADPVGKEGVAHFLEHLVNDGSENLPDEKAVREFSRTYMLNSLNAFTSQYWTDFVGQCLPENLAYVLEKMIEYIFSPSLHKEDVEKERSVITQEAWKRFKNSSFLKFTREMNENMFSEHQRSRVVSPLGWPNTIEKIQHEDVLEFHKKNYVKENLRLFLVGNVDDSILPKLSELFKHLPSGNNAAVDFGKITKPKTLRFENYADEIGSPSEQLDFFLWRTFVIDINDEFGEQISSLLRDALMERLRFEGSLCYGVGVRLNRYKDYSDILIDVSTSQDKLEVVETEVWKIIQEIIEGKWSDRFDVIHKLRIDQVRSTERTSQMIIKAASSDITNYGTIKPVRKMIEDTTSITYNDVRNAMKEIFNKDMVFTNITFPSRSK